VPRAASAKPVERADPARSAGFFSELPADVAAELRRHGRRVRLAKGAFVHKQGDAADGLYSVVSGRIRISTLGPAGRELVLTDLAPGAVFGEISLFDDLPRTHDAVALERSELVIVPKRDFHALMAAHPALGRHFLRVLAGKLRLSFAVLDALALRDVTARLAQRLLFLLDEAGQATLEISQTDLALMVGATRQSVNKQLKAWERAGLIMLRGGSIGVTDRAVLRAIAFGA
jgi:CRP/FNR family transcriptional regulator, cyclic AMP receptor protein